MTAPGDTTGDQPTTADRVRVMRLVFGTMAAQTLGAAVRLGVVDALRDGQRTAPDLADGCGAHPQALQRLLRALAGLELLREPQPGTFELTPAGQLLSAEHPESCASLTEVFTEPLMVRAWEGLTESVRTGEPGFERAFGQGYFDYLEERPELSAKFNHSMSESTRATAEALPEHYDFSTAGTVVDVGGGDGTLLAEVLRHCPTVRGVLHDTPRGLAQATDTMQRAGVADRFTPETGDFFASVPAGGDLYLLKSVIHDWNDAQCERILRNIREVIPSDGRLLLLEPVLPPTAEPAYAGGYLSDLNMLVNLGGQERTLADFTTLLTRTHFTTPTVTSLPPTSGFSLIEARPQAS